MSTAGDHQTQSQSDTADIEAACAWHKVSAKSAGLDMETRTMEINLVQ